MRQSVSYSVPAPSVGGSVCPADGVAPAEGVVVSGGVAGTSASTIIVYMAAEVEPTSTMAPGSSLQ